MPRFPVLTALVAGALTTVALAQQTPTVFRGSVELVAVDFMAVDAEGRPVIDLRPDELTLTVNGRARPIASLQFVRLVSEEVAEGATATRTPLPQPFGTNAVTEAGRTVILVFHHESIRPGNERQATDAAARFLDSLAPYDRVGLVTMPNGRVEVDLTTDHDRVRTALKTIVGHSMTALQTPGPKLSWLRSFLDGLAAIDGPKTIVFISEGVPVDGSSAEDVLDLKDVAKAAGAVRAHFYVIQPGNFANDAGTTAPVSAEGTSAMSVELAGLQDLAGVTGGELFRLSGKSDKVFSYINRESSAYYLLGFAPDEPERNGKSHRIELTTSRPRVTVRSRLEFTIPKPKPNTADVAAPTLPALLRDAKPYRDVPLRALAYGSRDPGAPAPAGRAGGPPAGPGGRAGSTATTPPRQTPTNKIKVIVVAESAIPGGTLKAVSFAVVDDKGKVAAIWPADAKELSKTPVVSSTVVAPGKYRLRVAAVDADDHRGTVDYEFEAALTKAAPLQIGALMLGDVDKDGAFLPRLEFGPLSAVTGYVEMYGTLPKNSALSVTMELAKALDGPAIARISATMQRSAQPDRFLARGSLPLGAVTPGDYIVRAIVNVNDAPVGRVVRTMRKLPR